MFVVWRKKPVTTDRKAVLFQEWDGNEAGRFLIADCRTRGSGWRWIKPIYCEHKGTGRILHTPCVMHAERIEGKPRQRLIKRLPGIRSCCLADGWMRAAWWDVVMDWDEWMRKHTSHFEEVEIRFYARDRDAVLGKLREVVPAPDRAGLKKFNEYKAAKEIERQVIEDEYEAEIARENEERRKQRKGGGLFGV